MRAKEITAILLAFIFLAMPFASAHGTEVSSNTSIESEAGITPDSSLYGLKLAIERLKVALTLNQEKKAQLELKLADKRVNEAAKMKLEARVEGLEKAVEVHEKLIQRAEARLAKIAESKNRSEEGIILDSEAKITGLEVALHAHQHRIEVLQNLTVSKNMSAQQLAKFNLIIAKMNNQTVAFQEKIDLRRDNLKIRLMATSGKNDSEAQKALDRVDRFEDRIEKKLENEQDRAEKMNDSDDEDEDESEVRASANISTNVGLSLS